MFAVPLTSRLRTVTSAAACAASIFLSASSIAKAETITPEGIWYTKGQESIIKVHPCAEVAAQYCGTLVWLKDPNETDGTPKTDKYNKDPTKKTRPILGVDILLNMKEDDDHWKGKAYNPEDGKLYDITFKVKTDKEANDSADLRGCILGFLCQTEVFARAKEVPGGDPTLAATEAPGKKHAKKGLKNSAHR